jgi:hypothetical protein
MIKKTLTALLFGGLLVGSARAQQNPIDNRFFLTDYFTGIDAKFAQGFSPAWKMGNTFSLGKLGKMYAQVENTGAVTLNLHNNNYNIEAVIGENTTVQFEIKKDNMTFGVSSDKSVHLAFLNVDGYRILNGLMWQPYARFDIGEKGPKVTVGSVLNFSFGLAPYVIVENGESGMSYFGFEFNTKKWMVALRGEVSKDNKKALLDVGYKF